MKEQKQNVKFDYSFLRGKIREKFGTDKNFAHTVGLNPVTLSLKLKNRISFRQQEIILISNILKLTPEETKKAFFTVLKKEIKGEQDYER